MAIDMFFQIGDVKAESADDAHGQKIDVLAWSWGANNPSSMHGGGGGGTGKVNVDDLTITKWIDKSSPVLLKACCNGTHLTLKRADQLMCFRFCLCFSLVCRAQPFISSNTHSSVESPEGMGSTQSQPVMACAGTDAAGKWMPIAARWLEADSCLPGSPPCSPPAGAPPFDSSDQESRPARG